MARTALCNPPQPMKPSRPLAAAYLAGFLVFGVFASLQVNDVDPAIYYNPSVVKAAAWLFFYGLLSFSFLLALFRRVPPALPIVVAAAGIVQMLLTGPGLWENLFGGDRFTMMQASMSAEDPRVEMTREFFGALLAFLAALGLLRSGRRPLAAPASETGGDATGESGGQAATRDRPHSG